MPHRGWLPVGLLALSWTLTTSPAHAQVEPTTAARYFAEADALCAREAGRLWGVSLCGPMVIADAASDTLAASEPTPDAARPQLLGIVNAPVGWEDQRWSAYVWGMIPADDPQARGRLLIHELFHRVQSELGLMVMGRRTPISRNRTAATGCGWSGGRWPSVRRAVNASRTARRASGPTNCERAWPSTPGRWSLRRRLPTPSPTRSHSCGSRNPPQPSCGPSRIRPAQPTASYWMAGRPAGTVSCGPTTTSGASSWTRRS